MREFLLHIPAKPKQPRRDIPFNFPRPQHLSPSSGRLPPPYLELKKTIARRVVSLCEKKIVLRLRVNVGDSPRITKNFHRPFQPRDFQLPDNRPRLRFRENRAAHKKAKYRERNGSHRSDETRSSPRVNDMRFRSRQSPCSATETSMRKQAKMPISLVPTFTPSHIQTFKPSNLRTPPLHPPVPKTAPGVAPFESFGETLEKACALTRPSDRGGRVSYASRTPPWGDWPAGRSREAERD